MTDTDTLQHTLSAMGLVELALAFAAIGGYALAFNPLLNGRGRVRAGGAAVLAAGTFIAMSQPWVNGVILAVLAVGGIGVFTALAWGVSAACGLTQTVPSSDGDSLEAGELTPSGPLVASSQEFPVPDRPPRGTTGTPAHSG